MKTKYIFIILTALSFIFFSCEEKDERVVYSHSTPVIESVEINPSSLVYGEQVTVKAQVSDPVTPLSTLSIRMIVNDMLIAEKEVRTKDQNATVEETIDVAFTSQLPEDADIEVRLLLTNVEGDVTQQMVEGIKGRRPYYEVLYLVLDNGDVFELKPEATKSDKYQVADIKIKSNKIKYRIAEKIDAENQIDFSGKVWGVKGGTIQLVDETGDYITTASNNLLSITDIVFDAFEFQTSIDGVILDPNNIQLDLADFADVEISGEKFKKASLPLKNGGGLTLSEELATFDIVFNMDYFDRTDAEVVTFKGEDGSYDLYYSDSRKVVIVDPVVREYPSVLLAAGEGLGYPSKIKPEAATAWDFNAPLQCIIFKKIANDTYQATVYFDATKANFKFFENRDWGNEKKSSDYTMPNIIAKDTDLGKSDGNWYATEGADSGNYKITINLATKVATAEPVTLP